MSDQTTPAGAAATEALPEGSLLLHIGPQKTGSTAIQMSMHEARADLAAQGVLYPGTEMSSRAAGWAVLGNAAVGRSAPPVERWNELVDELRVSPLPRACLSNEDFGRADDAAVERIMIGLGTDDVHLVFVARRLDKLLPSHWQERIKARVTLDYDAFLHHVIDDPDRDWEARVMWQPHDIGLVLGRWTPYVPRERITVIVADEADHALLPRTFENLLALRPGTLKPSTTRSNRSLSYVQAEALRRINGLASDRGWTPEQYWKIVQSGIVRVLTESEQPADERRITGLPAWAHALVADRADAQADSVVAAGVRVIGDPDRLRIRDGVAPAPLPEAITDVPLDLVADLVQGSVEGSEALHKRNLRAAARDARTAAPEPSGRELIRMLGSRVVRRLGSR